MLYFIFGLIIWAYYGTKIYNLTNKNFHITSIINSTTHASIIVLSYLIGIPGTIVYYISITYYILDTCYELIDLIPDKTNKPIQIRLYNLGIFIHHAIIIYSIKYIANEVTEKTIFYAFYLAELSNFPLYAVQYFKKTKYQNQIIINMFVIIEIISYLYLRLYLCGYHAYLLLFEQNIPYAVTITAWSMLIISAVWTWKLIMQVYNHKSKQSISNS
ncbi:hypothetical protein Klosneuvirus_4_43 [Klosneuvirus KNV1]|uniref:TLC domain-containing protein n=1 Tax=Klosneuvirus KNV1 TaxID=1977640 RepID=A0A1V0SKT2_9VIRU|nr:hypothetical protein Klosneuvirus_4_43 [Klosneuvirus KNV1]